ncbi:MAG: hypothetical protein AAFY73_10155 [Pseudomonadota bacterium]
MLTACLSSGSETSALNLQEEAPAKVDDALLAALSPGIIPPSDFDALPRKAKSAALSAEFRALEEAPVNVPINWSVDDKSNGQVVASTPYRVGSTTCRPYRHSGSADGAPFSAKGTACRSQSGVWEPII